MKETIKFALIISFTSICTILGVTFLALLLKPTKGDNYEIKQNNTIYICGDYGRYGADIKGVYCSENNTKYDRIYLSTKNGNVLVQKIKEIK